MDGNLNAEAGPSRPRSFNNSTPTPTLPTTPKSRRRSWFNFGSNSSTPLPPGDSSNFKSQSRKSSIVGDELEMSPVTTSTFTRPRQSAESAARTDDFESLMNRNSGDRDRGHDELLNIQGDPEGTIKKKKKKKKSKNGENGNEDSDEGEVMRMQDLRSLRRSSANDAPRTSHNPSFNERPFTRTASDRFSPSVPPLDIFSTPQNNKSTSTLTPSSVRQIPPFHRMSSDQNKDQPPIPHERPLPPLPPEGLTTPPEIPRSIVVTPSSPRKAGIGEETPSIHTILPEPLSPASDTEAKRSHSPSGKRMGRSPKPGPFGLGLPRQLHPPSLSDSPAPPQVPAKIQIVSSPLPRRTPSPGARIVFAELPETGDHDGTKKEVTNVDEKRGRVKRARSLSGIFSKSVPPTNPSPSTSAPHTPEQEDSPNQDNGSKSGGVLEWLGMKKTVKRRQSEAELKGNNVTPPQISVSRAPSPTRDHVLVDQPDHQTEEEIPASATIMIHDPSEQSTYTASSSAPQASSKLSSIFSRRQASRSKERLASDTTYDGDLPTPSLADRNPTASSSQSSFILPAVESVSSPIYPTSGPLFSSPKTELEELLFNPTQVSNWGPGVRPWMDSTEIGPRSARTSNSASASVASPLGSLPEQGVLQSGLPLPPPSTKEGRIRSWSDAPRPPSALLIGPNSSNPHLPVPITHTNETRISQSLQPSPSTPSRPLMGSRSNTANSAMITRMKTVFARGSSRQRSNTGMQRRPSSEIDEFGGYRHSGDSSGQKSVRPGSSNSSSVASPSFGASKGPVEESARNLLVSPPDHERTLQSKDRNERAVRTSMPGSNNPVNRPPSTADMQRDGSGISKARPRASTISTGPTTQAFAPPSPSLFPVTATPPRRRPSILHRVSGGLINSRPSSPRQDGLFPLPPRSSGSVSSIMTPGGTTWEEGSTTALSPGTSPRPSFGSFTAVSSPAAVKQLAKREGEETPEQYLDRILSSITRSDLSSVIASSADPFNLQVLKLYMGRFDFKLDPLDVALRKLLMHLPLPTETQQIDRVIEAFAQRYEECEPGLFVQKDNTYVLAFSMMMLHTDAFNRHNKNKMTKADYVRNTRLDGVSSLVLEAFFDNITFTPFVFIENDTDLSPSPDLGSPSTTMSSPSSMPPPKSGKIDIYQMILNNQLSTLRVNTQHQVPVENPFTCLGTRSGLNIDGLHSAFIKAHLLPVTLLGGRRRSSAALPGKRGTTPSRSHPPIDVTLKVTKVGVLSRKDDGVESKKSNRKWKSWSVILTGSQLLFFKDSICASNLLDQIKQVSVEKTTGQIVLPKMSPFKPDEVIPLKDCFAIYDRSVNRTGHHFSHPLAPAGHGQSITFTFRVVMPQGRQYLMQANDEFEMNEWINLINYASVFKSVGIRMRGFSIDKDQVILAGTAAAASHKKEMGTENGNGDEHLDKSGETSRPSTEILTPKKVAIFSNTPSPMTVPSGKRPLPLRVESAGGKMEVVDVDDASDAVITEGDQLEEVFDSVKAELAAGRGLSTSLPTPRSLSQPIIYRKDPTGLGVSIQTHNPQATRVRSIEYEIKRVEERIKSIESSIGTSLRIVRNLAILTPFQKSTRDRISSAIQPLSTRIKNDRLQLAKYELWELVLNQDLQREKREWARVRDVALQAATRTLGSSSSELGLELNAPGLDNQVSTRNGHTREEIDGNPDGFGDAYSQENLLGISPGELPILNRAPSGETSSKLESRLEEIPRSPSRPHSNSDPDPSLIKSTSKRDRPQIRPRSSSKQFSPFQNHSSRKVSGHDEGEQKQTRPGYTRSTSTSTPDHLAPPIVTGTIQTQTISTSHQNGSTYNSPTTTGASSPMMFSLSESEEDKTLGEVRDRLERNGTVKAR